MRPLFRLAAIVGLLSLLIGPAAEAASPAEGQLLMSRRNVAWSGGPFFLSEPNYFSDGCLAGANDPLCDHFALTINLPDGSLIEVRITTDVPNPRDGAQPLDGDDYDLFVYAPNGALIASAANVEGNERIVFRHSGRFSGKPYEVRVHPWFVLPGSTYSGSAKALSVGP